MSTETFAPGIVVTDEAGTRWVVVYSRRSVTTLRPPGHAAPQHRLPTRTLTLVTLHGGYCEAPSGR